MQSFLSTFFCIVRIASLRDGGNPFVKPCLHKARLKQLTMGTSGLTQAQLNLKRLGFVPELPPWKKRIHPQWLGEAFNWTQFIRFFMDAKAGASVAHISNGRKV